MSFVLPHALEVNVSLASSVSESIACINLSQALRLHPRKNAVRLRCDDVNHEVLDHCWIHWAEASPAYGTQQSKQSQTHALDAPEVSMSAHSSCQSHFGHHASYASFSLPLGPEFFAFNYSLCIASCGRAPNGGYPRGLTIKHHHVSFGCRLRCDFGRRSIHLNISSSQVPIENCQNSIKLESDMFFEAGTYSLAKSSAAWSLEELLSTCPTLVSQNLQSCRMLRECFESCKNHVGLPVFPCFLPHYV